MRFISKLSDVSIKRKALALVALPLIFELFFVAMLVNLVQQADRQTARATASEKIAYHIGNVGKRSFDAVTSLIGFAATKNTLLAHSFDDAVSAMRTEVQKASELAHDDARLNEMIVGFKTKVESNVDELVDTQHRIAQGSIVMEAATVKKSLSTLEARFDDLRRDAQEIISYQLKLSSMDPALKDRSRRDLYTFLAFGLTCNIAIAVALALLFTRSTVGRLSVLMDNNKRLSQREQLHEPVDGHDEIAQLDKTFHEMAHQLKQAEQMKTDLLNMISHDLRTPLTSMQLSLNMTVMGVKGELPAAALEEVGHAESTAADLVEMINNLLDVAKFENNVIPLQPEQFDVVELVQRVVETLAALADQKDVTVRIEGASGEVLATGDKPLLRRVLQNLIGNAIKFSPSGKTVTVKAKSADDMVSVFVDDEAAPIEEEMKERIFDRYVQADAKHAASGSGLGLSICRMIVAAHGGLIGVTTSSSGGNSFWFRIPEKSMVPVKS